MKFKVQLKLPENPAHQDINSHSEERIFSTHQGIDSAELRSLARDTVHLVASGCETAGAKDVSHVKVFIEHSSGFLHADTVSGNGEITIGGRDGKDIKRFRLVMNAVIFGLSEQSIRTATERALDAVQAQYHLTREQAPENKQ